MRVMQLADLGCLYAQDAIQSDVRLGVHDMTCVILYKQDPFNIPGQDYMQARSYDSSTLNAKLSLHNV